MNTYHSAYVYVCWNFVEILKETDFGYSFKYDEEYISMCKESFLPNE